MTGKEKFKKFNLIIVFIAKIIMILPRKIRIFLYDISMSIPSILGVALRYILIKTLIKECGNNIYIARWVTIKNFDKIIIGNNVSIHEYSYIDGLGKVVIGNDVSIAHSSSIISFEHTYSSKEPIKYQNLKLNEVRISNDIWIGCGCRILSGSNIEDHVVIAANSVIKNNVYKNSLYAGSPAKKVKDI